MPKYRILVTDETLYEVNIEAQDPAAARELVYAMDIFKEADTSDSAVRYIEGGFRIVDMEEVT